jgi:hypothetical protein
MPYEIKNFPPQLSSGEDIKILISMRNDLSIHTAERGIAFRCEYLNY